MGEHFQLDRKYHGLASAFERTNSFSRITTMRLTTQLHRGPGRKNMHSLETNESSSKSYLLKTVLRVLKRGIWRTQRNSELKETLIFLRFQPSNLAFYGILLLNRQVILEVNGDISNELRFNRIQSIIYKRTLIVALKKARFIAVPTEELRKRFNQLTETRISVLPSIVSLPKNLDSKSSVTLNSTRPVHGLFIGTGDRFWYNLNFLYELAKQIPEWLFTVAGVPHNPIAPTNVTFVEFQDENKLVKEAENYDFGIGSLGLWQINLESASSLKISTYIKMNIPVVVNHLDSRLLLYDVRYFLLKGKKMPLQEDINGLKLCAKSWRENPISKSQDMTLQNVLMGQDSEMEEFIHHLKRCIKNV